METALLTIPFGVNQDVVGYMVNTKLADGETSKILDLQRELDAHLPGALWLPPRASLHITLLDLIAPLVEYARDKDELFVQVKAEYDQVLVNLCQDHCPISVDFTEVVASSNGIILRGKDDGSYDKIRKGFVAQTALLAGSKPPPKIIHCSIARFSQAIELKGVQKFVNTLPVQIRHSTKEFRLVRETKDPMLEFKTLKTYSLYCE